MTNAKKYDRLVERMKQSASQKWLRPVGQAAKTRPSQGWNGSSILPRVTIERSTSSEVLFSFYGDPCSNERPRFACGKREEFAYAQRAYPASCVGIPQFSTKTYGSVQTYRTLADSPKFNKTTPKGDVINGEFEKRC